MSELHVYEIYSGASDYVVAESGQEAVKLLSEWSDIPVSEYESSECFALPDDQDFTIQN